ncbi:hypothetical protein CRM22_000008 [Opisthorchis felineus]|uniref:Ubiquinol-cytochrome c chaperone domain-containing protein n=1 Tax=Opisthorchis felineus TaxID=147828 RepID=A0A4S2MHA4_OPIFE|nr:hypothetical protein CRM22_000008 [Opisthorchis felineus]TGZ76066.1 hypothetical protein CRM22_000008 [Opisthorchis felineus]
MFTSKTLIRLIPSRIPYRSLKLVKPNVVVPNLYDKAKYRLGLGELRYPLTQLTAAGENMFAVCAEYPVFEEFVETLGLPDTFQSWFSLTTLHMWLCLVRLRQEGIEGQLLKRPFVNLFWLDLKPRLRTFKILRRHHWHITAFRMQFFGAILAYDEGFLAHSDTHLTVALWRNLFVSSPTATLGQLEQAVDYVRKNLQHLDNLPSSTLLRFGTPTFLPLNGTTLDKEFAHQRLIYCVSWPSFAR